MSVIKVQLLLSAILADTCVYLADRPPVLRDRARSQVERRRYRGAAGKTFTWTALLPGLLLAPQALGLAAACGQLPWGR